MALSWCPGCQIHPITVKTYALLLPSDDAFFYCYLDLSHLRMMMHFSIVTWFLNNGNAKSRLVIGELARNSGIRLFWAIILLCPFHERVTDDLKVTITHANLTICQFSGTLLGLKRGRASSYFLVCVDLSQNSEIWLIFWDVLSYKNLFRSRLSPLFGH